MAIQIATRTVNMDGCWASWDEKAETNVIRTTMDDGTIKVRRRGTGKIRTATVSRNFNSKDYDSFQLWFNVACKQGVIPTRMMTPYGKDEVWRFAEPPAINWIEPGAFSVACTIEQLPGWDKL